MANDDKVTVDSVSADVSLSEAEQLLQAFFREAGFSTPVHTVAANVLEMSRLDICRILLAKAGDRAVGIATVSLDFGIEFGWSSEVGDLYVLPAWRGRGIARRLMEEAVTWSRSRGATSCRVTITAHGREADLIGFYRRIGFSDEGRQLMAMGL